jgi:hypothetical protein
MEILLHMSQSKGTTKVIVKMHFKIQTSKIEKFQKHGIASQVPWNLN